MGPKKKMLFVDDRTKRIEFAQRTYSEEYDVTIAANVPEALRQLCSGNWDVVSLDHDLNGHDFQDPDTPTCGMEIVRYIKKCGGWWEGEYLSPEFWIHSSNLFAAHLMIVELSSIGIPAFLNKIIYPTNNMTYDEQGLPIK